MTVLLVVTATPAKRPGLFSGMKLHTALVVSFLLLKRASGAQLATAGLGKYASISSPSLPILLRAAMNGPVVLHCGIAQTHLNG